MTNPLRPYQTVVEQRDGYGRIIIDHLYFYVYNYDGWETQLCGVCRREVSTPFAIPSGGAARVYGNTYWCLDCFDDIILMKKLEGAIFGR